MLAEYYPLVSDARMCWGAGFTESATMEKPKGRNRAKFDLMTDFRLVIAIIVMKEISFYATGTTRLLEIDFFLPAVSFSLNIFAFSATQKTEKAVF